MKYFFLILLLLSFALFAQGQSNTSLSRYRITLSNQNEDKGFVNFIKRVSRQLQMRAAGVITPKPGDTFNVIAVAYSPTVDQNDASPCVTASGSIVRRGVVATNFLPIGTRLKIGDETFTVEDRMNSKYNGVQIIDIWHPTRKEALAFGRKDLEITILPEKDNKEETKEPETIVLEPESFWEKTKQSIEKISDIIGDFATTRVTSFEDVDCSKISRSE